MSQNSNENIRLIKAVNSISHKFSLSEKQLTAFFNGIKAGRNENSCLAEMLGAPEGVDHFHFLHQLLTAQELTALKKELKKIAPPSVQNKML